MPCDITSCRLAIIAFALPENWTCWLIWLRGWRRAKDERGCEMELSVAEVMRQNGKRELLFLVTAKDCRWSYTRGTGAGGQKRNKTSSAVHCFHDPSGAHGFSQDGRSQRHNRELAFERMVNTEEFRRWHRRKAAELACQKQEIEQWVNQQMMPWNLKIEYYDPEND